MNLLIWRSTRTLSENSQNKVTDKFSGGEKKQASEEAERGITKMFLKLTQGEKQWINLSHHSTNVNLPQVQWQFYYNLKLVGAKSSF